MDFLWRRLCVRKEETNRLAIWENLDRQGLAIICLHNHFLVSFKLTDFSKKRAISACWGTIACQQLLRANSQKLKNYFWRRAIIKGQHPHLITYRDLSNFSYHLTTVPLVIFAATLLRMSSNNPRREKVAFHRWTFLIKYTVTMGWLQRAINIWGASCFSFAL